MAQQDMQVSSVCVLDNPQALHFVFLPVLRIMRGAGMEDVVDAAIDAGNPVDRFRRIVRRRIQITAADLGALQATNRSLQFQMAEAAEVAEPMDVQPRGLRPFGGTGQVARAFHRDPRNALVQIGCLQRKCNTGVRQGGSVEYSDHRTSIVGRVLDRHIQLAIELVDVADVVATARSDPGRYPGFPSKLAIALQGMEKELPLPCDEESRQAGQRPVQTEERIGNHAALLKCRFRKDSFGMNSCR